MPTEKTKPKGPPTHRARADEAKVPRAGQRGRDRGNGAQSAPTALDLAVAEFLRSNPVEAKRWEREERREAGLMRRRRAYGDWVPPALPRPRRARKRVPRSALQRGFATLATDPRFPRWGYELAGGAFHPDVGTSLDNTTPAALTAAQRPWHVVENARFAAVVLEGAEGFYRALRTAYQDRGALERDLAAWPSWPNTARIEAIRARIRWDMDGTPCPGSAELIAECQRIASSHTAPPRPLWPAWDAAAIIPPGCRFLALPRERGRGRGACHTWPAFVRVEVDVAGHRAQTLAAPVDPPAGAAPVARVDLLAPGFLTALYGPGGRCGPKSAAQAAVADLVGRSRAQVEKLAGAARARGAADTAKK